MIETTNKNNWNSDHNSRMHDETAYMVRKTTVVIITNVKYKTVY